MSCVLLISLHCQECTDNNCDNTRGRMSNAHPKHDNSLMFADLPPG
jgi:hypothetical protein